MVFIISIEPWFATTLPSEQSNARSRTAIFRAKDIRPLYSKGFQVQDYNLAGPYSLVKTERQAGWSRADGETNYLYSPVHPKWNTAKYYRIRRCQTIPCYIVGIFIYRPEFLPASCNHSHPCAGIIRQVPSVTLERPYGRYLSLGGLRPSTSGAGFRKTLVRKDG
jgi:hypothetical protein